MVVWFLGTMVLLLDILSLNSCASLAKCRARLMVLVKAELWFGDTMRLELSSTC